MEEVAEFGHAKPNAIELLQCIYRDNTSCVKVNDYLSKPFKISMGLRQGCVLSPILFNLFVNDLPAFIAVVQEGVQFGESSLSCLLYADDLVILAENEAGIVEESG